MPILPFRVKRYAHGKYKFLVRWKLLGKWRRRYFATEDEAMAFAGQKTLESSMGMAMHRLNPMALRTRRTSFRPGWLNGLNRSDQARPGTSPDFFLPAYLGPRIERYIGHSWCMHLPFAYDLMREFAPRVFVELGVKQGESYFAFCQSAADNNINVRCYGVDSWRGDIQTGELDPKVQAEAEMYNCRYSSFSELKGMLFVEALKDFPDATIDLLHRRHPHLRRR